MAVVIHTPETLGEIVEDLEEIKARIARIRDGMRTAGIENLGIDYDKMQCSGRVWLHRFAGDGTERLRAAERGVSFGNQKTAIPGRKSTNKERAKK